MKFLLDTNVISEIRKGDRANPNVARWIARTPVTEIGTSVLVLAERPQRVLTRDQLLDLSRGRTANNFDRSIDVQISRIRRKIEADPKEPALIKTVRSEGYILTANVTLNGAPW